MPPKGVRRSRSIQVFTQTMPLSSSGPDLCRAFEPLATIAENQPENSHLTPTYAR